MILSIRDIAFQLRQGQLIALADETGWSIAVDPVNEKAVGQLIALTPVMPASMQPTVVIEKADQLGLYVAKLPDIAYDLVDFAEDPLIVVYDQGKNVSSLLWQSAAEPAAGSVETPANEQLAVRRSLSAEVQRLIGSFGRGLLTIPFESLSLPASVEPLITIRFGTMPALPKRPRILRLKVNGEVSFIRK
jgi:L-threonylcarbamoyladenylate synthase